MYTGSIRGKPTREKSANRVAEDPVSGLNIQIDASAERNKGRTALYSLRIKSATPWAGAQELHAVVEKTKPSTRIFMYNLVVTFELKRGIKEAYYEEVGAECTLESIKLDAVGIMKAAPSGGGVHADLDNDRCTYKQPTCLESYTGKERAISLPPSPRPPPYLVPIARLAPGIFCARACTRL